MGDSFAVTERTRLLGQQLSVPVESHTNTPDHALTERFLEGFNKHHKLKLEKIKVLIGKI